MPVSSIIASERQAREITATVASIDHALSSDQVLKAIVEGLPREVIDGVRRSLMTEKRELLNLLAAYAAAKEGQFEAMRERASADPGALLIVARIVKGWSQKELARKLGLREQAIQRYEAERYRSISLAGLIRVARVLDTRVMLDPAKSIANWTPQPGEITPAEAQKILKHAREYRWLDNDPASDENGISLLIRYVAEHVGEHGTPSLLRTGLNVIDHSTDWLLLSWKAQVTRRAKAVIARSKPSYRPLEVSWLKDLVRLSQNETGPAQAIALLAQHGIVVIVEPGIPGMKVDGAAFLVDETPVIGLTIHRDSIDNFWFTLLHEVAHVILHYRTGLASGFFDDVEIPGVDEFEQEANRFAENMLIPEEVWARSPARIAKTAEPIERLAKQLQIAPAIIFGRVRWERKNYGLFANQIGQGKVLRTITKELCEVSHETA